MRAREGTERGGRGNWVPRAVARAWWCRENMQCPLRAVPIPSGARIPGAVGLGPAKTGDGSRARASGGRRTAVSAAADAALACPCRPDGPCLWCARRLHALPRRRIGRVGASVPPTETARELLCGGSVLHHCRAFAHRCGHCQYSLSCQTIRSVSSS
ncbi:MAG: hypothetical protein ACPIOQ_08645 [Promethearchaeia archaeon]